MPGILQNKEGKFVFLFGRTVQFSRLDSEFSFGGEIRSKLCLPASSPDSEPRSSSSEPPSISPSNWNDGRPAALIKISFFDAAGGSRGGYFVT